MFIYSVAYLLLYIYFLIYIHLYKNALKVEYTIYYLCCTFYVPTCIFFSLKLLEWLFIILQCEKYSKWINKTNHQVIDRQSRRNSMSNHKDSTPSANRNRCCIQQCRQRFHACGYGITCFLLFLDNNIRFKCLKIIYFIG